MIFGTKMSGKGSGRGIYQGQGGRLGWILLSRGRSDRGHSYYGDTPKHTGLCSAIGIHDFDYVQK